MRAAVAAVLMVLVATAGCARKAEEPAEAPASTDAEDTRLGDGTLRIVLPRPREMDNQRYDYITKVLTLALDKTSERGPYQLIAGPQLSQGRQVRALEEDELISIVAMGTTADYEQRLTPIRFPLFRGTLGYRVCVIRRDDQARFSAVRSLRELRSFTIGQQRHWADVPILRAAGFELDLAPRYDRLFPMVRARRFDCLSRGILEAYAELTEREKQWPDLAVESELMLIYPQAQLLFTRPGDQVLAPRIAEGLARALEDGSFLALFDSHPAVKPGLDHLRSKRRRIFRIPNPVLTDATRSVDSRLWLPLESLMPPADDDATDARSLDDTK